MARYRNRTELCPYCHCTRSCTINLDIGMVTALTLPRPQCKYGGSCVAEVRDKALLEPFEDGKVRTR